MPIDARIPLGAIAPQMESPLVALSQITQIRAQRDGQRDRDEERQDRALDRRIKLNVFNRTEQTRKALQNYDLTNPDGLDSAAQDPTIDPDTRLKLHNDAVAARRTELTNQATDLENNWKKVHTISQVLSGAHDQTTYDNALGTLKNDLGIDVTKMNPAYVKSEVDGHVDKGMTFVERAQAEAAKMRQEIAKQYQTRTINWQGKPMEVPFDPDTSEFLLPDGTRKRFAPGYVAPKEGREPQFQEVTHADGSATLEPKRAGMVTREAGANNKDNPELPAAVESYIGSLAQKSVRGPATGKARPLTRAEAEAEFISTNQRAAHPKLSDVKVNDAFDRIFGKPKNLDRHRADVQAAVRARTAGEPAKADAQPAPPFAGPSGAPANAATATPQVKPSTPSNSQQATPQTTQRATAPKVGDVVTVKGKRYTVGKVYPDGSWDPK